MSLFEFLSTFIIDAIWSFSHGTILGKTVSGVEGHASNYSGIICFSRDDFEHMEDNVFFGIKWQCVEFARRYWYKRYGCLLGEVQLAADIWKEKNVRIVPTERNRIVPLRHFENGAEIAPREGDLVIYDIHPSLHTGHVAVVVEVGDSFVRVAEQNRNNGKMWPGNYSFELRLDTKVKLNSLGVTSKEYHLHDHDCHGLLGWMRLMLEEEMDSPPWQPTETVDENQLGTRFHFWRRYHRFLGGPPINIRMPGDYESLCRFVNNFGQEAKKVEVKRLFLGDFESETVCVLQRFLNKNWKLACPDVNWNANARFHVPTNGVFDDATIVAFERLIIRVQRLSNLNWAIFTIHKCEE